KYVTPSKHPRRPITNRLWRFRTARRLSQKELARSLGHQNVNQVSRWENGVKTPTLDSALLLAHVLKAPVEALFADRLTELLQHTTAHPETTPAGAKPPCHAIAKKI